MLVQGTSFCLEVIVKIISKPLGIFADNAIFRIFIKISFPKKNLNVLVLFFFFCFVFFLGGGGAWGCFFVLFFLIKCVMQVICKLDSA